MAWACPCQGCMVLVLGRSLTRVQAAFPGLGRLQPCCGVSAPCPPDCCPCPSPRGPHAPSVASEEVAPLLPRAPGPSCSGPRCKWLLVSVLCACSPASSGGCLVPGGTTSLPTALHTKNGIETGWPGCFLEFPFLLCGFCPRGPGGVQTVPWRLMWVCGVGERWGGCGNSGRRGSLCPTGIMPPGPLQPGCQAPSVSPWLPDPTGHLL